MTTPKLVLTALTVAALTATSPAVATAEPRQAGCSSFYCGTSGNHNEILVTSTAG